MGAHLHALHSLAGHVRDVQEAAYLAHVLEAHKAPEAVDPAHCARDETPHPAAPRIPVNTSLLDSNPARRTGLTFHSYL